MPSRSIVVIGASAGGVEAISQLIEGLASDLPAAVFVVMHFPAHGFSVLPQILSRCGGLPAAHATDREPIEPGKIYVAPPNHHLIVQPGEIHLNRGPRENGHRPAIDTLFRSAAYSYRQQVVGVILSGALDDGALGLLTIKQRGGRALVQDPEEALFDSMPRSALDRVEIDYVLRVADIAFQLNQLVYESVEDEQMPDRPIPEEELVAQDKALINRGDRPNTPSTLTCPDCGGILWELQEGNLLRYRCHVGHAYSMDSLILQQSDSAERALWAAVRVLEEKASLSRRMAIKAEEQHRRMSQSQFLEQAKEAEQNASLVRQIIFQQTTHKVFSESERSVPLEDGAKKLEHG